ncbi:hypothetical protein H0H92_000419 [Tricholoma furcatifolium]|nr:hypothetical protein H0H92_000419 [Tricholoma furcatifolium]
MEGFACYHSTHIPKNSPANITLVDTNNNMEEPPESLPSTVDETLSLCPCFRILVAGYTGAGKSSLIADIFNVGPEVPSSPQFFLYLFKDIQQDIDTTHDRAGKSDINRVYGNNRRIAVHDSPAFQPGMDEYWNIVKYFMIERSKTNLPIKERLHALCPDLIQLRKLRFLDHVSYTAVDEELLELAIQLKIPVILVFTKFNFLLDKLFIEIARGNGYTNHDEVEKVARSSVDASAAHLREKMDLPSSFERSFYHVPVSTQQSRHGFMPTLELKEVMAQCSKAKALNVLWDIAQRFDPKQKLLASNDFHVQMLKLIAPLMPQPRFQRYQNTTRKFAPIGTLCANFSTVVPPLAIALGSVGADAIVTTDFLIEKYRATPQTVACLEAYIVDLILFLHELFVTTREPLNGEIVLSTLTRYKETKSDRIHEIIQNNACSARDASKGAMAKVEIGEIICRELQIDVERTAYSRLAEYCSLRQSVQADKAKAAQFKSSARLGPTKEDEKRRMAIRRTEQRIDLNQEQMERLDIPAFTRLRISLEDLPDEVMRKIYAMIGAN